MSRRRNSPYRTSNSRNRYRPPNRRSKGAEVNGLGVVAIVLGIVVVGGACLADPDRGNDAYIQVRSMGEMGGFTSGNIIPDKSPIAARPLKLGADLANVQFGRIGQSQNFNKWPVADPDAITAAHTALQNSAEPIVCTTTRNDTWSYRVPLSSEAGKSRKEVNVHAALCLNAGSSLLKKNKEGVPVIVFSTALSPEYNAPEGLDLREKMSAVCESNVSIRDRSRAKLTNFARYIVNETGELPEGYTAPVVIVNDLDALTDPSKRSACDTIEYK